MQFCTLLRASSFRILVTSSLSVPVTCTSSNSHSLSALKRSHNPVVFTTSSAYALSFLSLFSVLFVFFFFAFFFSLFFLFQLSARLTQSWKGDTDASGKAKTCKLRDRGSLFFFFLWPALSLRVTCEIWSGWQFLFSFYRSPADRRLSEKKEERSLVLS